MKLTLIENCELPADSEIESLSDTLQLSLSLEDSRIVVTIIPEMREKHE